MKKLFTLFALFVTAIAVNAYDVVINDMCFDINKSDKTATFVQDPSNVYQYLGDIVIPEKIKVNGTEYTVTGIGGYAFFYSKGLTSVKIPETVETIETYAFSYCDLLKEIIVPSKVKKIEAYTFSDCISLEKIVLPEGLEEITDGAFYNCKMLKSLTLPSTMKIIDGKYLFSECKSLTEVHANMAVPMNIPQDAFDLDIFNTAILYVPQGTINLYKETMYWDLFVNIQEEDVKLAVEGVEVEETENNAMYDLQGRRIYAPIKGIYIQNGKKIINK